MGLALLRRRDVVVGTDNAVKPSDRHDRESGPVPVDGDDDEGLELSISGIDPIGPR